MLLRGKGLETFRKNHEEAEAARKAEKQELLDRIGKAETKEELRNCIAYIVDRYIIK